MNYQMTLWKAGLCLVLSLLFLPLSTYAEAEIGATSTILEELAVRSDNPIMIIRCRGFDDEENEFTESNKNSSSKKGTGPCGHYFKIDEETGGCVPDCEARAESRELSFASAYEYNSDTGECDCNPDVLDDLKSDASKEDEGSCGDSFCFLYDPSAPGLKGSGTSKEFSPCLPNPCPDDIRGEFSEDSPNLASWFHDDESGSCFKACFDGELSVEVPKIDCGNLNAFNHVAIQVCFTSADINNPLIPGQRVPFADIQNCFGDAGEPLLQVAIDENSGAAGSGEEYYFDAVVGPDGKLCVDFFVDPNDPLVINFSNSAAVEIGTCVSDPCSCENPDNIKVNGAVVRFADRLILNNLPAGVAVGLNTNNNPGGFTNAGGIAYTTQSLGNADANGTLTFEFFRGSNQIVDIIYQYPDATNNNLPITRNHINGRTCDASTCAIIPTMGQWGLLILAMLLSSLALVFIGRRRMA